MRDLQPVFGHSLAGTARVDVDHRVRRRFRWMVLLELTFALLISICALPVLAIVVVLGGGGELPLPDLDDLRQRAWIRYRVLRCTVVDAAGQAQVHSEIEIRDTPHADALMGALLAHCDAARVVLVERLAGGPVTTAWYGGQPLGQAPERLDEAHATRTLDHAGTTLDTTAEGLRLVLPAPRPGRFGSALGMVLLAPLSAWTGSGRNRLADLWAGARGVPRTLELGLDKDSVRVRRIRGDEVLLDARIDRKALRGMGWGPVLTDPPSLRKTPPLLRLQTADNALYVNVPGDPATGRAARDLLVIAAQRLWHHPSAGTVAAHCPYCATLYTFGWGVTCPSCGAPPTALHGLALPCPPAPAPVPAP